MPTTRARSRAPKEPSVEELKEAIKGIHEELDDLIKRHNTLVEECINLSESHDVLWDWHKRHWDSHKIARVEEPPEETLREEFRAFYSFLFSEICRFGRGAFVLSPLLLFVFLSLYSLVFWVENGYLFKS